MRQNFGKFSLIPLIIPLAFLMFFFVDLNASTNIALGSVNDEEGISIAKTSNGFVVAGSVGNDVSGKDIVLTALDGNYDVVWSKRVGGSGDDVPRSVIVTSVGDIVVLGSSSSFGVGDDDIYVVKTDASGNVLWSRTYGGFLEERGFSIAECSDGGYIIGGSTQSAGAGLRDAYLVKVDGNGNVLWSRVVGTAPHENCFSVQQTTDGGYIYTGTVTGFDFQLTKLDASASIQWNVAINLTSEDHARMVKQTLDGGYVCVGHVLSSIGDWDVLLVKVDSNGVVEWSKKYGGGQSERVNAVNVLNSGEILVTGHTNSYSSSYDLFAIKVNDGGDFTSGQIIGAVGEETQYFGAESCVFLPQTNEFAIVGTSDFGYIGGLDMMVVVANATIDASCVSTSFFPEVFDAYPSTNLLFQNVTTLNNSNDVTNAVFDAEMESVDLCCDGLAANIQQSGSICSDGFVTLEAEGGYFAYEWDLGDRTSSITVSQAGTYCVTVSDETGCTASDCTTVIAYQDGYPTVSVSVDTDYNGFGVSCFGEMDGSLSAMIGGGGVGFEWSNGETSETLTGLAAGNYSVTVSDENGCFGTASVSISEPPEIDVSISSDGFACANPNGTLTANASGGVGGYAYNWNSAGGAYSGETIANLPAGTYSLTVTDANSCTATDTFTATPSDTLGSPDIVNDFEGGSPGGPYIYNTHQITVGGGMQPYSYSWNNSGYVRYAILNDAASDSVIINIIYTDNASWALTVTDACASGGQLVFDNHVNNGNLILDIDGYNIVGDMGNDDGEIEIFPSGGDIDCGYYEYEWTSAADPTFLETTQSVGGLASGWYIIVVTDCSDNTTLGTFWVPGVGSVTESGYSRNKLAPNILPALQIAPNPTKNWVAIEVNSIGDGDAITLEVFNLVGVQIATLQKDEVEGITSHTFELDVSGLPAGIYVCRLTMEGGETLSEKISIIK